MSCLLLPIVQLGGVPHGRSVAQDELGDGALASTHLFARPHFQATSPNQAVRSSLITDLDGDALPDLVVASSPNRLDVLFNLGGLEFSPYLPVVTAKDPNKLVSGDFDGDGDEDLAVTYGHDDTLGTFRNDGLGGFEPWLEEQLGDGPGVLVAGDLDGNGSVDLVVVNHGSQSVSVLLNSGGGAFASQHTIPLTPGATAIALADLDGDGDLDVAVTNFWPSVLMLLTNPGDGQLVLGDTYGASTPSGQVTAADIDGDSDSDLLVARPTAGEIDVLVNDGFGTFQAQPSAIRAGSPVTIGDIDGDSDIDLATGDGSQKVKLIGNDGLGAFSAGTRMPIGAWSIGDLHLVDLDLDSDLDLAVMSADSQRLVLLPNRGGGRFPAEQVVPTQTNAAEGAVADLDGDGDVDVVTVGGLSPAMIAVPKNRGDGRFGPATLYPTLDAGAASLALGDFNGDGAEDVVTAYHGWLAVIHTNDGTGAFSSTATLTLGEALESVATGDVDLDGSVDIVAVDAESAAFIVVRNHGDGSFGSPTKYLTKAVPICVKLADLDGDGDLDAVTCDLNYGAATLSVFANAGDGTYSAGVPYPVPLVGSVRWVACGDLDGDGDVDLLPTGSSKTQQRILWNAGDGTFGSSTTIPLELGGCYRIELADFDHDGNPDLLTANEDMDVGIALGHGNGTFDPPRLYGATLRVQMVLPTDFDDDGRTDLAVTSQWDVLTIMLNRQP